LLTCCTRCGSVEQTEKAIRSAEGRNAKWFPSKNNANTFSFFSGGIVSYSSPPPDLPGSANVSLDGSNKKRWSDRDSGVLHDGYYGDEIVRAKDVPNYGRLRKNGGIWRNLKLSFLFRQWLDGLEASRFEAH
jgi:hypothetical protein